MDKTERERKKIPMGVVYVYAVVCAKLGNVTLPWIVGFLAVLF